MRPRTAPRRALLWSLVVVSIAVAGCSKDEEPAEKDTGTAQDEDTGSDDTAVAVDTTKASVDTGSTGSDGASSALDSAADTGGAAGDWSKLGSACVATVPPEGACGKALVCFPTPGGFCTAMCNKTGACGGSGNGGGVCVPTARAGAMCAPTCTSDDDCRKKDGYRCDKHHKACVHLSLQTPVPPACTAKEPARKLFGKPVALTTKASPADYQFEPGVAITSAGDVRVLATAMTIQYTEDATVMWPKNTLVAANVSGDANGAVDVKLPTEREHVFDPWLAADTKGNVFAVWLAFDGKPPGSNFRIAFSRTADGKTWSKPTSVSTAADCPPGTGDCLDKPMIAAGPAPGNPKLDAIYVTYAMPKGTVLKGSPDGGKTFSSAKKITDGVYGDLLVATDGSLHIAVADMQSPWDSRFGAKNTRVIYRRSNNAGGTISAPVVASKPGVSVPFYFSNAQVEHDVGGKRTTIVYPSGEPDLAWQLLRAVSTDDGKTWQHDTVNDDKPCATHITPSTALDAKTGDVWVMWRDNRAGHGIVAIARCPAGKPCEPSERVSDTPFAAFSMVRHNPAWLGEYDGLHLHPKTRRLHAVWTQPFKEDGGIRSRIMRASAVLK